MRLGRISLDNKRGFTLIELLIVLALFSFVTGLIYDLYNTGVAFWKNTEKKLLTVQEARMSLERVVREARGAKEVMLESSGFSFKNLGDDTISFHLGEDGIIRRYVNGKAGNIIATDVKEFSVIKVTDTEDSYIVEMTFKIKGNEYYTVKEVFTPRNIR